MDCIPFSPRPLFRSLCSMNLPTRHSKIKTRCTEYVNVEECMCLDVSKYVCMHICVVLLHVLEQDLLHERKSDSPVEWLVVFVSPPQTNFFDQIKVPSSVS